VAKKSGPFARFALDEAQRGYPYPLIGRLTNALRGSGLSDDEIQFIVEALEATEGKRGTDRLREIEQMLIAEQVEELSKSMSQKEAIEEVMRQRDRSRRHVFNALKAHRAKPG
jgi:hypothetical protein